MKTMAWRVTFVLLMMVGLPGCENLGRKEAVAPDQILIDSLKVKFPGRPFNSVELYRIASWLNGEIYKSDALWDGNGELLNGFTKPGKNLIPAHIADLNVSLWHQKRPDNTANKVCRYPKPMGMVYRDRVENPIAGIIFDLGCRKLKTWPESPLTLNDKGWERLEMMTNETWKGTSN